VEKSGERARPNSTGCAAKHRHRHLASTSHMLLKVEQVRHHAARSLAQAAGSELEQLTKEKMAHTSSCGRQSRALACSGSVPLSVASILIYYSYIPPLFLTSFLHRFGPLLKG
jgi:hypothetical protein